MQKQIENEQEDNECITHLGNYAIIANGVPHDRGVKEMTCIIGSKWMVKEVCKYKFKQHCHLIDIEAWCQFHRAMRSAVKCMAQYNHHSVRHSIINQKIPSLCCLRCRDIETWSRAVACQVLTNRNEKFMQEVISKRKRVANTNQ